MVNALPPATIQRIADDEGIAERASKLADVVASVLAGLDWQTLLAAPQQRFEWHIAGWTEREGVPTYLEGVIDAAWQTAEGWQIVDWKTDDVSADEWAERLPAYERQVATYADLLGRALGVSVSGRLVRVL